MNFVQDITHIVETYGMSFLRGAGFTMLIAMIGTIVGFFIGLGAAIVRTIPVTKHTKTPVRILIKTVQGIVTAYVEIFRGTPMMVQAMILHFGIFTHLFSFDNSLKILSSLAIISINTGAYMAEIVRGGIISVDPGQTEGAHSIGMTHWQTMTSVILPQAIRNIMPSIGNEFVVNIKDSSVLNVIGLSELFFNGKSAAGQTFKYYQTFLVVAAIYLVLTFTVTRILKLLEKKMDGNGNYTVFGSQSSSEGEIHISKEESV